MCVCVFVKGEKYRKEKKENRKISFKENFEISASRYGGSVSPKWGGVGLWPTFYFQFRNPELNCQLSESQTKARNSGSCARQAASARGNKSVLQCGCNARR